MDDEHFDWASACDDVIAEQLQAAAVVGPPVDAVRLATTLGFLIAVDDRQQCRARHVELAGYDSEPAPAILIRPEPRVERRQWAVAHEIGEHLAVDVCARLAIDPADLRSNEREQIANAVANRLLLPSCWFASDGEACDWNLPELKRLYSTASYELIARRMLDCEFPAVITIVDHGRVTFRRSNLRGRLPSMSEIEQAAWQRTHISGRPQERRNTRYRVRAWAVHEPDWKREIVRTEPSEGPTEFD